MSYTPRGTSDLHAKRRREAIRRHLSRPTFTRALDAVLIALLIAVVGAYSFLAWLVLVG